MKTVNTFISPQTLVTRISRLLNNNMRSIRKTNETRAECDGWTLAELLRAYRELALAIYTSDRVTRARSLAKLARELGVTREFESVSRRRGMKNKAQVRAGVERATHITDNPH